jgi:hypothetical protein
MNHIVTLFVLNHHISYYANKIILHLNFIFKYQINYRKYKFKIILYINFDKNHYKDIILFLTT